MITTIAIITVSITALNDFVGNIFNKYKLFFFVEISFQNPKYKYWKKLVKTIKIHNSIKIIDFQNR